MRLKKARPFLVAGIVSVAVCSVGWVSWWLFHTSVLVAPPNTVGVPEVAPVGVDISVSVILTWALLGSLAITAASLIVAVRLLYWRKALQGGQTSIVPDRLLSDFATFADALRDFIKNQQLQLKVADAFEDKVSKDIIELKEALGVFTHALNQKDAEIDRFRRGGDAIVYHRFLSRFLRLNAAFEEELHDLRASGQSAGALTALHELLVDALLECGVERLLPAAGSPYSSEFGVADNPKIVPTGDKNQHLLIAEVLRPGFMIRTAAAPICLQPAQVSVYQFADVENAA